MSKIIKAHSLTGRITDGLMLASFKAVKRNRGAAGIDKVSLKMFEANLADNLRALMRDLKSGCFQPHPLRRHLIPKNETEFRPLGIPAVRDRVAQEVVRRLLNPIFEPLFHPASYGFRPRRNCHMALEAVLKLHDEGCRFVLDADIKGFLDNLSHDVIMQAVAERVADGNILRLVEKFLTSGVMDNGIFKPTTIGTPQGGVISPLLANIYLDALDGIWERRCRHLGQLVRYADDAVVLCSSQADAEESMRRIGLIMERLSLKLHPDKTRIVELGLGKQGFVFLGCYLRIVLSRFKGREYVFRWPSPRSMTRIRARIRELTDRRRWAGLRDIRQVIEVLNPVLRGWGNYFRTGNASWKFQQVDRYVNQRLVRLLPRARGWRRRPFELREWAPARFVAEFGLHRLVGTIRYPGFANAS